MTSCAVNGGCPTDYSAITIAVMSMILLLWRSSVPFLVHKISRTNGSGFWIPLIQVFGSLNLLLSIVVSFPLPHVRPFSEIQEEALVAVLLYLGRSSSVWMEGPLGFGLLLSCRITQAFQLYNIFLKRRLAPIRSYIFLPLILLPWISGAAFFHVKKPLNYRCHMGAHWIIPTVFLHAVYISLLIGFTWTIRHIEFRFNEVKDLWKGILVSATCIGVWIVSYVLNEVHDDISWLQVASRFFLLLTASVLVLVFFSMSSSQPLFSQISLRKREPLEFETMGQALGIPDSGLLLQRDPTPVIDPNEPLDKLLLDKRFRQSFMAFADSCLAGESMHFYNEVHELGKIPADDLVRRIYMARHIIEKYIIPGATMEVNISHRTRQEILTTTNLAHPDLFHNSINEVLQLMKMNLAKDYWSSMFFIKFKEEANVRSSGLEIDQITGWNSSPRLSSVHCADDPFHHENLFKGSGSVTHDSGK